METDKIFLVIEVIKQTLFNVKYIPDGNYQNVLLLGLQLVLHCPHAIPSYLSSVPYSFWPLQRITNMISTTSIQYLSVIWKSKQSQFNHENRYTWRAFPDLLVLQLNKVLRKTPFPCPKTPLSKYVSSLVTFSFFFGGGFWGAFFPMPLPACGFPLNFLSLFFLTFPSLIMST